MSVFMSESEIEKWREREESQKKTIETETMAK